MRQTAYRFPAYDTAMEDRIEELKARIRNARDAYFNLSPIMTDQEYDALVDELKSIEPNATEVTGVGAAVPQISVWEKVKHEIPMGSLDKANSPDEFRRWAEGLGDVSTFHITHKIDGSSMELIYKSGKLARCVTRGDGLIGEDVTSNVQKVPSIPKTLPNEIDAIVRGEIVMMKEVFSNKYAEKYANPRNTAAAKVREKKDGGQGCKDLEFIAYWIETSDVSYETLFYQAEFLQKLKFEIPHWGGAGTLDNMMTMFQEAAKERNYVKYEIDGMVISVNNIRKLKDLGDHNMRPRGQIAWKFDAAMRETRVRDVVWQVGPTGRLCPVAKVEPVNIGGVTISSVSLHNLALFRDLKLFKGCRVLVSRRNDVIPYIEKNLDLETQA